MRKVALVTGAGRGIGHATSIALSRAGYAITMMARSERQLADAVIEVEKEQGFGRALAVIGDVRDEDDCEAAVRKTLESFGRLDVLVNNAGIFRTAPLIESSTEMWKEVLDTNLTGVFLITRAAVRAMAQSHQGGIIVNVSSMAGKLGYPGSGAYCASKFGLGGFSAAIRVELRGHGIRVVLLCPGQVDTHAWDQCGLDLEALGIRRETMMRPEEVAEAIVFAAARSGEAAPEEILLTPRSGS